MRAVVEKLLPQVMQGRGAGTVDDVIWGISAAIFAATEGATETGFNRSFISRADGAWLDEHGAERRLVRAPNEPDAAYAARIRTFEDAVTSAAIAAAVNSLLETGEVVLHEFYQDGIFAMPTGATTTASNPTHTAAPIVLSSTPAIWWTWYPPRAPQGYVPFGNAPLEDVGLPLKPGSIVVQDHGPLAQTLTDSDNADGTGELIGDKYPSATTRIHYATGEALIVFAQPTAGPVTISSDYLTSPFQTAFAGQWPYASRNGFRLYIPRQGVGAIVDTGNGGFATPTGGGLAETFAVPTGDVDNYGAAFANGGSPAAAALYQRIAALVETIRAAGIPAEYFVGDPGIAVPQRASAFAP